MRLPAGRCRDGHLSAGSGRRYVAECYTLGDGLKIELVARPQFWGDGRQGTNVGLLPDGRHAARSVANGYFLHPQKEQEGRSETEQPSLIGVP